MLRSPNDLERYKVSATDGDIGSVLNFLLDDQRWVKAGRPKESQLALHSVRPD